MEFPAPIIKGHLIKRYKRFLADIDLDGEIITAHCANTGSMSGVKIEGACVWVTQSNNPNRKLKYDWQVIEVNDGRVCINTSLANKIVEQALNARVIPELSGYSTLKREVKYGTNSRIDFLLSDESRDDCYVEVKNVTLSRTSGLAEFPDSPTARGTKHLHELAHMAREGKRAVMLYLVNRTDCLQFDIARDVDTAYATAFDMATDAGVEPFAYTTIITEDGIRLNARIPIASRSSQ